jgi:hypothetical protein
MLPRIFVELHEAWPLVEDELGLVIKDPLLALDDLLSRFGELGELLSELDINSLRIYRTRRNTLKADVLEKILDELIEDMGLAPFMFTEFVDFDLSFFASSLIDLSDFSEEDEENKFKLD